MTTQITEQPSLAPGVSMHGNNSVEAGPYVYLGRVQGPGAVYIDAVHLQVVLAALKSTGIGLVTLKQHEAVVVELGQARAETAQYDHDRRAWWRDKQTLEKQVADLTDDVSNAKVLARNFEAQLREHNPTPAETARQALHESLS